MARRGLVALVRANRDAFLAIDGTPNLNLLRTGAHLQTPGEREVLAIRRDEPEHRISQQANQPSGDRPTHRTYTEHFC